MVEAEVISGPVLTKISKRTKLITVSLGSGPGGDLDDLFINDICGEQGEMPKHARAFGNLRRLYKQFEVERLAAVTDFRDAALSGNFPGDAETAPMNAREMKIFLEQIEKSKQNL